MKKQSFRTLLDNDRYLQIFSVAVAFLCWIAVQMTQNTIRINEVKNVPVTVSMSAGMMADLGLNPIDADKNQVNVTLRGPITVIGQLKADDLQVMASISNISEPNTYDLPLLLANQSEIEALGVEVESFDPPTVRVRFDRLVSKTLDIEPLVKGISTPPHYMSEQEKVTPSRVTITGPKADLDKIDRAVVQTELSEPLTKTHVSEEPIVLLDAQGDEIDLTSGLLVMDSTQAQLMVRVLQVKTLPLVVSFTNKPQGFPWDDLLLLMQMSAEEITLAGPPDMIANYQEIPLGTVDMKGLTIENSRFIFDIELPSTQFTNMDSLSSVLVDFDTEDWDTAEFTLDTFTLVNVPPEFDVSILTKSVGGVTLVGRKNIIDSLTAGDIVATIDLSDKPVTAGQYEYPMKITVPTKGMVWAVGNYSAIIQVE